MHIPLDPPDGASPGSPPPDAPVAPVDEGKGLIERKLEHVFGRSWRTSCLGLLALASGVLPLIPGVPSWVVDAAHTTTTLAAGGGLMLAKDRNVTGSQAR